MRGDYRSQLERPGRDAASSDGFSNQSVAAGRRKKQVVNSSKIGFMDKSAAYHSDSVPHVDISRELLKQADMNVPLASLFLTKGTVHFKPAFMMNTLVIGFPQSLPGSGSHFSTSWIFMSQYPIHVPRLLPHRVNLKSVSAQAFRNVWLSSYRNPLFHSIDRGGRGAELCLLSWSK